MTLLSDKTSVLCISIRCEGITITCTLFSGPLQVSYGLCGMMSAITEPQIASRLHLITTHITFLHPPLFRQLQTWNIC